MSTPEGNVTAPATNSARPETVTLLELLRALTVGQAWGIGGAIIAIIVGAAALEEVSSSLREMMLKLRWKHGRSQI